jgi:hypothetical protein
VPGCHAAFETASQIGITDPIEGGDYLLLRSVCRRHLLICGHAQYLCGETFEPEFSEEMPVLDGILLPKLLRRSVQALDRFGLG